MPRVSIIVPFYNAESHIYSIGSEVKRCLASPLSAEFVFVDDGSTDTSTAKLQELFSGDRLVRIFKRDQNGGVSSARNFGLKHAKGEWIVFLDIDDRMNWQEIHRATRGAPSWDIIYFSYWFEKAGNGSRASRFPRKPLNSVKAVLFAVVEQKLQVHISSAIYRREFIKANSLAFREELAYGEDNEFIIRALSLAKQVELAPAKIFTYTYSPGSSVNKPPNEKRLDSLAAMKIAFGFVESSYRDKELSVVMRSRMALNYMNIVHDYFLKRQSSVPAIDAELGSAHCRASLEAFRPRTISGVLRFIAVRAYLLAPGLYAATVVPLFGVIRKW